jgi:hypothetical protein
MEKTPEGKEMTKAEQTDYGTAEPPVQGILKALLIMGMGIVAFIAAPHIFEGAVWWVIAVFQTFAGLLMTLAIMRAMVTFAKGTADDIISELQEINKKEET